MKRLLITFALAAQACQTAPAELITLQGAAQGTTYLIQYYGPGAEAWQQELDSLFQVVNNALSTYQPGSLINQFNDQDSLLTDNEHFAQMVSQSRQIWQQTGGSFDPTVMPLVKAWGFGPEGGERKGTTPIDSLLALVGMEGVLADSMGEQTLYAKARKGIQLDFNAIAQGYTVDLIGGWLKARKVDNFLIELGGEALARGQHPEQRPWTLSIEQPSDLAGISEEMVLLRVNNEAVATSGNNKKFYEKDGIRYAHTIDPATGAPVTHSLVSCTVLAPTCATADAMATAFMVMGTGKAMAWLRQHPETAIEALFIESVAPGRFEQTASPGMETRIQPK